MEKIVDLSPSDAAVVSLLLDHKQMTSDARADLSCLCDSAAADQWKSGLPGGRADMNPMIPTLVRCTT